MCHECEDERYWPDPNDRAPLWPLIFFVIFLFLIGYSACYFEM